MDFISCTYYKVHDSPLQYTQTSPSPPNPQWFKSVLLKLSMVKDKLRFSSNSLKPDTFGPTVQD